MACASEKHLNEQPSSEYRGEKIEAENQLEKITNMEVERLEEESSAKEAEMLKNAGMEMGAERLEGERIEVEAERIEEEDKGLEERRTEVEALRIEEEETEAGVIKASLEENEESVREYEQLLILEELEIVPNAVGFTCPVCFADVAANEGVTLRDCLHSFCCPCLVSTVQYSDEAEIKCPYRDDKYVCDGILQDREIRAIVPEEVQEQLLARSVALAEVRMGAEAFHCKTPDCKGWCVLEGEMNEFPCPVCGRTNCLTCQDIHDGVSCWQHQANINGGFEINGGQMTKEMLDNMLRQGKAMACPSCAAIIMKDLGCDYLVCTICKMELCWVTRGPRWGPRGLRDTSGGCRCGVNGIKCHPNCRNCH